MMTQFNFLVVMYFVTEIGFNGVIPYAQWLVTSVDSGNYSPSLDIIEEYCHCAVICGLLYIFGRKQWPDYFSVGLLTNNDNNNNNGVNELMDYKIVPLLRTEINLEQMDR
jgi:hypothetical protein